MIITIDGPAGTGKSTVAKELARRLGFQFLNTGAMYRAVAWRSLSANADLANEVEVAELAAGIAIEFHGDRVLVNGRDVTETLRQPDVTELASIVASNPSVRRELVRLQQEIGRTTDLVTEGRDQGTIVFPEARVKFFVTASVEERAQRRMKEIEGITPPVPLEEIREQIRLRDERDRTRACAPMVPAADAIVFDTTGLSVNDVIEKLEIMIRKRIGAAS